MKILCFVVLAIGLVKSLNGQEPFSYGSLSKEALKDKLDSIVSLNYKTFRIVATDYDNAMPEGMFGYYLLDSAKQQVHAATVYTYNGRVKTLTNYYFFEKNLIALNEVNVPITNQTSQKLSKLNRSLWFWNGSVIAREQHQGDTSNNESDLIKAREVLKRFENRIKLGKLVF